MVPNEHRDALHKIYVALFRAHRKDPDAFNFRRLTTITTALMGIDNVGWRVVGITRAALTKFADSEFAYVKGTFCRGHINNRAETAEFLFDRPKPLNAEDFITEFFAKDRTVLMLKGENSSKKFPAYIPIRNPKGNRFPNRSVGWKHGPAECGLLSNLSERVAQAVRNGAGLHVRGRDVV